ncbi:MAG: DUF3794 domain-containing protein [Clostridia bacterium]|nr:DUF3794 domain-containing protein [Clostridia bacterium]
MEKAQVFSTQLAEDTCIQRDGAKEAVITETSGEWTLPDYLPEIRKILRVSSRILPEGRFVSGGRAEFAGSVCHTVIYSDGEGGIVSSSHTSDYEFSVPVPTDSAGATVSADTVLAHVSYRLGGPRKISIRATVHATPHVRYDAIIPKTLASAGDDVERLSHQHLSSRTYTSSGHETTLADSFTLDGYGTENIKVIFCDGKVLVNEARAVEGGVVCRGEATVRCIYCPENGSAFSQVRRIPFEETVAVEGANATHNATAYGCISSVDVALSGQGNATVMMDAAMSLTASTYTNDKITLTDDMYSTSCEYECVYEDMPIESFIGSAMSSFTLDGSGEDTKNETVLSVIDTDARLDIKEVVAENGRAVVKGNCCVSVLTTVASDLPGTQYCSFEYSIPVSRETDLRAQEGAMLDCRGEAVGAKARIDTKGISFEVQCSIAVTAHEHKSVKNLCGATPIPCENGDSDADLTVCYPMGATLWQIAKKYRVHPLELCEQNGIGKEIADEPDSPISLDGITSLIIEK